jgi:pectinesterase
MIPYILALCLNLCLAFATARTSAPAGALIVSKAPSKGQYSKVQDAVNALSTSSTTAQSIFIEAGTYSEQVYIAPRKAALTIYGYSTNTDDYNQNVVTITQKKSLNDVATDDLTATLRAWSTNFKLYNVNLVNSYGNGGQALAVNAAASVRHILSDSLCSAVTNTINRTKVTTPANLSVSKTPSSLKLVLNSLQNPTLKELRISSLVNMV